MIVLRDAFHSGLNDMFITIFAHVHSLISHMEQQTSKQINEQVEMPEGKDIAVQCYANAQKRINSSRRGYRYRQVRRMRKGHVQLSAKRQHECLHRAGCN